MRILAFLIETTTALMLCVAAATAWTYAALVTRSDAIWMSLLLAVLIPLALRTSATLPRWQVWLAPALLCLTIALSSAAAGVIRLSLMTGMRPDQVLARIDAEFLFALARYGFAPGQWYWLVAAILLAALLAFRLREQATRSHRRQGSGQDQGSAQE